MDWGLTIPRDFISDFEGRTPVELGTSRDVEILWDKKKYAAKLSHINRKNASPVYQLRWDNNKELLNKIRKTFIQSYVVLKSQKELFDKSKKDRKHFRTKLTGEQQEVLRVNPLNEKQIIFDVFIRVENEWNDLFERLAEENVFGWLFDKNKKYLISKSTNWIKVIDFNHHANAVNVIYYLANTRKKLLYIGKAENLGKRVTPGKKHMDMDGDWDLFKYDIVYPEFANILERIEDHTIRSFASILKNNKKYPSLELSTFKLVNRNWKKL
jgi:hypothetical protein|tara:strand:+ start:535 stop:1341 length:807 start_codon:yes stop_codon:yes gene_type:complete